jgi:hypothetical protein
MTDYLHSTGASGTMMIRDNGGSGQDGWVEFWLKANSSTYNYQLPWAYVINGVASGWQQFRFVTGGNWQKLGAWWVTSSQNVTFKLGSTGTNSLGGPTDFTQYIDRARVPDPPTASGPYNVTGSTCDIRLTDNWDGGAGIGDHQIAYGQNPWSYEYLSALSGGNTWMSIGGLAPGGYYYFWGRSWNPKGWSNWGNRVETRMLIWPNPPSRPVVTNLRTTSLQVNTTANWDGGSPIIKYELGYGTDPVRAQVSAFSTTAQFNLSGLSPGTNYYFWVRAYNAIGSSPWSERATARTYAGCYIRNGGTWKLAVPYVKVDGVWTPAQPFVRSSGTWKQTV